MATKTGRNEPCPCGSGKKYKRCCADRDAAAARDARAAGVPTAAVHVRSEWVKEALDEIMYAGMALVGEGTAGQGLMGEAFAILEPEPEYAQASCIGVMVELFTLAPRVFDEQLRVAWQRLLRPRLSPRATLLLDLLDGLPPRVWVAGAEDARGRDGGGASTPRAVEPLDAMGEAPPVRIDRWLSKDSAGERATEHGGCWFGWCLPLRDATIFVELARPPRDAIDGYLESVHDPGRDYRDEDDQWLLAFDLLVQLFESDPNVQNAPAFQRYAAEDDAWHALREERSREVLVNSAMSALLGTRTAARAVARAAPKRLVTLVERAIDTATLEEPWAAASVDLAPTDLLGPLGFDERGQAEGVTRDALSRHPIALLAPDPEGAGLPAVDPRTPIGAAAAVARATQAKALDKALTGYEREVRFAHLTRAFKVWLDDDRASAIGWRYDLVQAGLIELAGDALGDLPLSRLGLPRGALSRLTTALTDDGGAPVLASLPSTFAAVKRLRGVGQKSTEALVDALEALFASWRWHRAGIDRASFTAGQPAGDEARETLSAGLDQLDELFR